MITHPERLERGHPFRQWKTWTLPGTRLTLTGYSRANDKTFFHVPELKLALDAGLAEGRQVDTVLLMHTHLDPDIPGNPFTPYTSVRGLRPGARRRGSGPGGGRGDR
ncbi:hypothetical protein ACWENQ_34060 [Nonomuraea sp. NPDC004354]